MYMTSNFTRVQSDRDNIAGEGICVYGNNSLVLSIYLCLISNIPIHTDMLLFGVYYDGVSSLQSESSI